MANIEYVIEMETIPDYEPDTSWLEQDGYEDRLEALHNGDFGFIGVRATTDLRIPDGRNGFIIHSIHSPGIWGVEDDSSPEYLTELFAQEAATLREMIAELQTATLTENAQVQS